MNNPQQIQMPTNIRVDIRPKWGRFVLVILILLGGIGIYLYQSVGSFFSGGIFSLLSSSDKNTQPSNATSVYNSYNTTASDKNKNSKSTPKVNTNNLLEILDLTSKEIHKIKKPIPKKLADLDTRIRIAIKEKRTVHTYPKFAQRDIQTLADYNLLNKVLKYTSNNDLGKAFGTPRGWIVINTSKYKKTRKSRKKRR